MAKAISKTKKALPSKSKNEFTDSKSTESTSASELNTAAPVQDDSGLEELLLDSIKDIYWAENHLVKALPKMIKAASSSALQQALTDHLAVTKGQVMRLENVFEMLGKKKQAKKCDAMEGIVMEGEGVIDDTNTGTLSRDIGLIHASRKVENYEMTNYKGIIQLATALGKTEIASLLSETLAEEQQSDDLLANIAEQNLTGLQNSAAV